MDGTRTFPCPDFILYPCFQNSEAIFGWFCDKHGSCQHTISVYSTPCYLQYTMCNHYACRPCYLQYTMYNHYVCRPCCLQYTQCITTTYIDPVIYNTQCITTTHVDPVIYNTQCITTTHVGPVTYSTQCIHVHRAYPYNQCTVATLWTFTHGALREYKINRHNN